VRSALGTVQRGNAGPSTVSSTSALALARLDERGAAVSVLWSCAQWQSGTERVH
jgi:hypothetical protein